MSARGTGSTRDSRCGTQTHRRELAPALASSTAAPHRTVLHRASPRLTAPHRIALHCTALHRTAHQVNLMCNFFKGSFDKPKYFEFMEDYFIFLEAHRKNQ